MLTFRVEMAAVRALDVLSDKLLESDAMYAKLICVYAQVRFLSERKIMGELPTSERLGNDVSMEELTRTWIRCLVPLSIVDIWLRGGMTDADLAADEARMLERAMHGESLLFYKNTLRTKKKGLDTESMLRKLVDSVALLAFCVGGIFIFTYHFDADDVRREWGITDSDVLSRTRGGTDQEPSQGAQYVHHTLPDPRRALIMMHVLAWIEVRHWWRGSGDLIVTMTVLVLRNIRDLRNQGGVTESAMTRIITSLDDLEMFGDDLFILPPDETANRLKQAADALSILAFLPGGVTWFGTHFQGSEA